MVQGLTLCRLDIRTDFESVKSHRLTTVVSRFTDLLLCGFILRNLVSSPRPPPRQCETRSNFLILSSGESGSLPSLVIYPFILTYLRLQNSYKIASHSWVSVIYYSS
jgi:hypothetical protein